MRAQCVAYSVLLSLAALSAWAHGPQIQVTDDNHKIVTRQIIPDAPYGNSLTAETSVYVLPIRQATSGSPTTDYWTVMANSAIDSILDISEYPFGPGLAYGYGHTFADGFHFSVSVTTPLEHWNGASFVNNPGPEAVGAFRGDSSSSPDQFAVTGAGVPAQSLAFGNITSTYNSDSHSSLRFRLLGDGTSALVAPADGIYLLKLQISSTQPDLAPSDEFSLLLVKNATAANVLTAVANLGVTANHVQYLAVPEPPTAALAVTGLLVFVACGRRHATKFWPRSYGH
ncbi:MAG TPA: hypothetical protein VGM76_11585 [Lacipirellulaceae bacterium]